MSAKTILFILALLAIGMMFSLVSSHPLTEEEEQKLFGSPATPNKEDQKNFKNPFSSNEGDKQNFFKNPFPSNEGDKPNYFKNPFPSNEGNKPNYLKNPLPMGPAPNEELPPYSMRGFNYWLNRYNPRATMTCDKFPRVCREKGSSGPDCCKKKCVNVMTDNLNCGECGRRCRFGEMCCGGTCVSVLYDKKNCGACKNRCKKGSFCNFGMCSYA
ncbi:Stigma-specific STIG1-like protein 1 [Carex littledalei]|uniref:Stigma-specific STIG1-like protein 1 n=1 Tax=Carex littledalei TaxID=544730 RepID=A0A833QU19_9POAL|nr:Stigma-specific STIG1-like protein 1 [Carex littledalei]